MKTNYISHMNAQDKFDFILKKEERRLIKVGENYHQRRTLPGEGLVFMSFPPWEISATTAK